MTFNRAVTDLTQARCLIGKACEQVEEAIEILGSLDEAGAPWPPNGSERAGRIKVLCRLLGRIGEIEDAVTSVLPPRPRVDPTPDEGSSPPAQMPAMLDLGERLVVAPEAGIVRLLKARVGRHLERGSSLCELALGETTIRMGSPVEGTFLSWLVDEGERVAAGRVLARIRPVASPV